MAHLTEAEVDGVGGGAGGQVVGEVRSTDDTHSNGPEDHSEKRVHGDGEALSPLRPPGQAATYWRLHSHGAGANPRR